MRLRRVGASTVPMSHESLTAPKSAYTGFASWWRKVQDEDRDVLFLDADTPEIGIAVLAWRSEDLVKLCTFALSPGTRGVGSNFLSMVLDHVRENGGTRIYATVPENRPDLLTFFRKHGMDGTDRDGLRAVVSFDSYEKSEVRLET